MSTFAPSLRRLVWRSAFVLALALALTGSLQMLPTRPSPPTDICLVAPPTPFDAGAGLGLLAPRSVPAEARCPVCGMYPARSRDWAAQVIFKDNGDTQFFDSPLSLLVYLQDVGRYTRGRSAAEIGAVYVSNSASNAADGSWIKAETAIYVQGSSALGPMRAGNLPAFADAEAAQAFADRRGGRLLRFEQIDAQLLAGLAAKLPHRH